MTIERIEGWPTAANSLIRASPINRIAVSVGFSREKKRDEIQILVQFQIETFFILKIQIYM